jgi:hypothetical protein
MVEIYRTTIFPVVLYGCETWSLTFKKEHRLINSKRMGREWHVARMVQMTCIKFYSANLKGIDLLQQTCIDVRILLK